jgi:hypothetical protein
MPISDTIKYFLQKYGEPLHAQRVSSHEVDRYGSRLPSGLLRFWIEHGRGYYLDGKFWICDPALFNEVLNAIFADDLEFSPSDMLVYAYSGFGNIWAWHKRRKRIFVNFLNGQIHCPPESSFRYDKVGEFCPDDFILGNGLSSIAANEVEYDDYGEDLLPQAIDRLGKLEPGEIYGFFPPRCFGGTRDVANLRKTPAIEHMMFLAQVCDLKITRLTESKPGHPFGEIVPVRRPSAVD